MTTYTQHPLSAAFPAMPPEDFDALCEDIRVHGQRDPIVVLDGEILDGWHRYQACLRIDFEPMVVEFDGDDPAAFVLSRNLHRRHLSASQRAVAVAKCMQWKPAGRPKNSAPGAGFRRAASTTDMAKAAGVGTRTVEQAKKVVADAEPEVVTAVEAGEVSVKRAAEIADLPKEQQAEALKEKPAKKREAKKKQPEAEEISREEQEAIEGEELLMQEAVMEMRDSLRRLENENAELKAALAAQDKGEKLLAVLKRAELAERRRDELMNDAARLQKSVEFWQRQLARVGRAVGERDLDRVAPAVEALVRQSKRAAA